MNNKRGKIGSAKGTCYPENMDTNDLLLDTNY